LLFGKTRVVSSNVTVAMRCPLRHAAWPIRK
jgi:hypothetical protein